nr:zinc finger and SCAN domain-containing protein 5B-like isoform X1 [Pogona vitticeps]
METEKKTRLNASSPHLFLLWWKKPRREKKFHFDALLKDTGSGRRPSERRPVYPGVVRSASAQHPGSKASLSDGAKTEEPPWRGKDRPLRWVRAPPGCPSEAGQPAIQALLFCSGRAASERGFPPDAQLLSPPTAGPLKPSAAADHNAKQRCPCSGTSSCSWCPMEPSHRWQVERGDGHPAELQTKSRVLVPSGTGWSRAEHHGSTGLENQVIETCPSVPWSHYTQNSLSSDIPQNHMAIEDRPSHPEIYSIALWGPKLHSALTKHRGGRANAQASAPNSKRSGQSGDAADEGSLVLIDAEGVPHTVTQEEVELAGQMQSSEPELLASAPPPRQLYFCPICLRTFLYQSDLERHSITHSESKPYVCRECGKAFKRSSHLQRHKHIHTGERPFNCPVCRKGFRESGELLRHQRVHTGEKPYQCQICRLRFTERNTLRRHAKRKHARETYYQRSVEEGGGSWTTAGDWESEVVSGAGDWGSEELESGWTNEAVEDWVGDGSHWGETAEGGTETSPVATTYLQDRGEPIQDKDTPVNQPP